MRGNCSFSVYFTGDVPKNRLGNEHESGKALGVVMMPVVALTYAAAYLGICVGAYEIARIEASKQYPGGARRLDNPVNKRRMGQMRVQIEAARSLLHLAAKAASRHPFPIFRPR